ncbi:MAG: PKD domain-containing protein, partial [Verrucomicrobia bacterium]|nr:PKD domain-containing protein [Verrucomicrobiota bacterium]
FDRDQETITGNSVYSNRIGIHLADSDDIVTNNLVYANADQGILLEDADRIFLRNNTVFHPVGNALEIRNGTADADIRNNILWIEAGFNVRVTSDSTSGLELDYNLYNRSTDPNARQGDWQGSFVDTLPEWQSTTGLDANSIFADPAFFDKDGADDIFAYVEIGGSLVDGGIDDNFHLLKNSPAIDRGFFLDTPVVDLEGDSRKDDPGTANQGSDRYDPTLQASQLFQTGSGDSQFMRGDDGSYFYGLPFDFSFFGKTYDRLEISSNGYVQFDTFDTSLPDADNDPQALVDSANPTMAVLWDDLTTGGASGNNIYIDESITGQVTIRWQATYKPDDTAVNMALVLFDDGAFRFDYGTGNSNLTPTVGIADGNGRAIFAQYDGVSTLDSVSSIAFPFAPGFDDIGAYEFKGSSLDDTPPVIVGTDPLIIQQGGNLQPTIGEFEVIFSEAIDSIDARSIFSYQLILDVDENGLFEESDQFFTLLPEYENLSDRVTLRVEEGGLPSGNYQLQIFSQNLRDVSGNALDGNEDDSAGGNYLRGFSIFDTVAPTVDFNIDPADRENAGLSALTFVFDETLDAAPTLAELELRNQDSGDLIDPVDLALQWDPESRTATLTFPGFADSLLPPAAYELTVLAAALSDAAGNPLDGNGDGTAGDNAIFGFLVETIQNPVADFAISPTQGDTGTTFTFDGTLSTDPDGVVATYAWDFGDGATATGSTPQHQFDESGTYSVRLTVTDDDGATDTVTNQLSVSNQAPQITFTVTPESGEPDTEFIFDASASVDNDGTIQSYVWEFGDGTTATGVQVSHQYNAIGLFTATLTLSDNEGAVISADKVIAVGNQPPVAVATVDPEDGNSGTTFTFDGTGSSDPDGLIASYVWDFGDGESATGVSVNHSYASGGNYTATLTVTDDEGSIATTDLVVSVSALPDPVASFTVDPESGDTGTTFTFDAGGSSQVDGTLTDFVWDFGDGNTATGESVTHSFDDVGTYSVSLTVTNNEGTEASTSQTVEVVPLALEIVDFVVNDGAAQRSVVDRLELVFNGDVGASVADANLRIFDRVAGAFLDPASFVRTWDAGSLTLALTFPGETGGSLPDGAYTLVVAGESLSTADGKVLDADGDGTPGGTAAFDFHRLFGDVTGTGGVSVFDAIMFRAALGSADGDADYRAEFDEANTLTIDAADRARFEANLGRDLLAQAAYSHTDPPARTIVEVSVNDGAAQRSMVETLEVTFDYALEGVVTVGDLRLFNRTTGARVDAADLDLTWSDDARTAQLDFSGLTNGTLSDGYYTLVIDGDTIEFQGIALDGDGDGSPGGVFTHDFHRIFGDLSGSGAVSVADALQFGAAFGSVDGDAAFEPAFDEAGDLEVDAGDRARFEANLGRDIAAEAIFSYDLPAVRDVSVNGGVAQRSTVESIELTFTLALENDVSVDDFRIFNRTAGARVNAADLSLSWSDEGRIAQLDFSALDNGTLADGFYTLVLDGDALDRAGTALDGDADGTPGGVFTYDFHRLFGDATGTTTVSTIDALHFRQALGSADGDSAYRAYFDHDSNDLIDADDRDAFEARLGSSIEPEAIAPVILTEPPAESSAPIGDSVSLSVDAQSAAPLTYSWYRDDSLITSGASLATLEIEELSPSDLGSYRVEIANRFGVISSLTSELIADP